MAQRPEQNDDLHEGVKRRERLAIIAKNEGERSVGQNLALIGSVGWLVMLPAVAGIFTGRWLDSRFTSGIFWTSCCIVLGVSFGAWLAWRRIKEEKK